MRDKISYVKYASSTSAIEQSQEYVCAALAEKWYNEEEHET
jgi:hypothetical protein